MVCGGIGICLLWRKRHQLGLAPEPVKTDLVEDSDRFGGFKVMHTPEEPQESAAPIVHIVLPHLPEVRPLGLELMETRVIRVHPWGAKHGFRVGDIIVDISGVAVHTFEELWQRVQIERARPPVRFSVERRSPNLDEAIAVRPVPPAQVPRHEASRVVNTTVVGSQLGGLGRSTVALSSQLRNAGTAGESTGPASAVVLADTPVAASRPSSSGPLQAWAESPQGGSAKSTKQRPCEPQHEEVQEPKPPRITYAERPKSKFEQAFGDPNHDRLQEIVDRHNPRTGAAFNEVRFARDAWGRSI